VIGDERLALAVVVPSIELGPLVLDGCLFLVCLPDVIGVR
jgi:hypothetical protein